MEKVPRSKIPFERANPETEFAAHYDTNGKEAIIK